MPSLLRFLEDQEKLDQMLELQVRIEKDREHQWTYILNRQPQKVLTRPTKHSFTLQ